MTSFEEKVYQLLADRGLSVQELADQVDMPEPELRVLCHRNDPRCSEMELLGAALRVDPVYFLPPAHQHGLLNQVGFINNQKIRIGKAAAHELAAQLGVCRHALELATRLATAYEDIIALLRDKPSSLN